MLHALPLAARLALALLALLAGVVAVSAAGAAVTQPPLRGRMVEIAEGRRLRLVCEGPAAAVPVVWFEAGAFGFAADWASVQARLSRLAIRSCAYDRAGLGFSDPGPAPRDSDAAAADLERLIAASGETGPFLFVGHSAAGLSLRRYAGLHPDRVMGLVLVDAMTPESARVSDFAARFPGIARWAARAASLGLFKPLIWTSAPDRIGLLGAARTEKRHAFASGRHNRAAAAEVSAWPLSIAEGLATPPYDPAWPVAVVLAGPASERPDAGGLRGAPAVAARRGRLDRVEAATHASLLGEAHADRIVAAIRFVAAAPP